MCVQQKQHYEGVRTLETQYESELRDKSERIHELELAAESRLQSVKLTAQSDLSRERHAWNKERASLETEFERVSLVSKAKELEIENYRKQVTSMAGVEHELCDDLKRQLFEINSLKLAIEEERTITRDHVTKSDIRIRQLEESGERVKLEYETKLSLSDKKSRIRKIQLDEAKETFIRDKADLTEMRVNVETLLHQEQVLHSACREELDSTKKELDQVKMLTRDDQVETRKKIVEFALREEKFLSQIETMKMAMSTRQHKIDELDKRGKESRRAYETDLAQYKTSDTQLRVQVNTLKGTINEMKTQMTELTTDEEKRLISRATELDEKEKRLNLERKHFAEEAKKTRILETQLTKEELDRLDAQKLYHELKSAIEEAHVLRVERDRLLEQCNKQQAQLRTHGSVQTARYSQVEKLQYEMTKQQLGLVALQNNQGDYKSEAYSEEIPTRDQSSFLDSELTSLPQFDQSSINSEYTPLPPVKPKKAFGFLINLRHSRKIKYTNKNPNKQTKKKTINYNQLRPT